LLKIYGKQAHDAIVYLFIEILHFFLYKKKFILIFLVITIYQFDKKKLDNNTFAKRMYVLCIRKLVKKTVNNERLINN